MVIYQVIDVDNSLNRTWTGSAARAIQSRDRLVRVGKPAQVVDYRGRRLNASDLVDCAARENERHATSSLKAFKRLIDPRFDD